MDDYFESENIFTTSAHDLINAPQKLSILGLFAIILRLPRVEGTNWLDQLANIKNVHVVRMTFAEFFEEFKCKH